jgi:hypothetical protein
VGPNTTDSKTATVDCTGGRLAISCGFTFSAGTQGVSVRDLRPTDNDTCQVIAEEVDAIGGASWSLQAHAVCGNAAP